MSGEYEHMGTGELLARLGDWMQVATDRGTRIVELEAERDDWRNIADDVNAELADIKAERDRLREAQSREQDAADAARTARERAWQRIRELEAERDRLRAVVDAVSVMWDNVVHANPEGTLMGFPLSDYDTLERALDALDVSPTMGTEPPATGAGGAGPHASGAPVASPDTGARFEMTDGQRRTIADAVDDDHG